MRTVLVVLTRDLRVHDNPALASACRAAETVVPLYVADPEVPPTPARHRFLRESLDDLRASLRERGGDLVVRRGDPVEEAVRLARAVGAEGVGIMDDYGERAVRLRTRLADACERERIGLRRSAGAAVVAPGALLPSGGGDHYKVFTPYWRVWSGARRREPWEAPERVRLPEGVDPGGLDEVLGGPPVSPATPPGGEGAGLERLDAWTASGAGGYADLHDDLAADGTSRLSAYLHFGCLSPLAVAVDPRVPEAMVRQLCWRDFFYQVLAAFPRLSVDAYRRGDEEDWADDAEALEAWRAGRTGVPVVDAGMRQLLAEGWMHNRARLITAGYLCKTLGLDWRAGAEWFARHLVDADDASNGGNWQWVAGTGNDARPHRGFNAERQAGRFDPDGVYVRRWLD